MRTGYWMVAALFLAYAALYWQHVIEAALPIDAQFSYFAASCSVICMVLALLLAARPRPVETPLGGLDRMYRLHKYLGVAALLLFVAHYATVPGEPEADAAAVTAQTVAGVAGVAEEGLPIDLFGLIAMIGFTLLIIITLNRKIPYHRWLPTHRLMGLFFAVVSAHVLLVLYDGEEIPLASPPGAVLALLLLAGLAAFACRQFRYPAKRRRHPFALQAVNRLERATEVVLHPKQRMFPFKAGQFAFVAIDADGFQEAHPFTISSGTREPQLRFTMKVLGDYTRRVRDELDAGADVTVEGPYGRFEPLQGSDKKVWVAGGIGITPFLSALRTIAPGHGRTVRLYYCVRSVREALFLDEVEALAKAAGGVTVTRVVSEAGERLDAGAIDTALGGALADWSYYLCGPQPMITAISKGLLARGARARRIHHEAFEFR